MDSTGYGPPPSRWQADTSVPWRSPVGAPAGPAAAAAATDVDQVSGAWKHIKSVVREDGKPVDLYDLLAHNVRDIQYSLQPPAWPALLRAQSPIMCAFPALVMERFANRQAACFCGLFPEIRRVWASIDNSLFIWRFDRWDDVPVEYSGEEQAICAVGLAKPRKGVFVEAVQHLLVVCTTIEVVLLGVCCGPSLQDDITLQPLPLYTLASDNVTMTCVRSTPEGRIFLGGADGHLYEVLYNQSDSIWRSKRCTKKDHTGGLTSYFPPMLGLNGWIRTVPLVELVVDADRHFLYGRYQNSAIQVWDLGPDGQGSNLQGSSIQDIFAAAQKAVGGRDIFGGRSAADRKGASIVSIIPIPPSESNRLHLLAVTADARRIYLSAYATPGFMARPANPKPDKLKVEFARQSLPLGGGGVGQPGGRSMEVTAVAAGPGVLLLADAEGAGAGAGRSRAIMAASDLSVPPLSTATGQYATHASLRETVAELDMLIPGETCAIALLEPARRPDLAMRNELSTQLFDGPQRYVLVSTSGVLKLEKRRPVDMLRAILEERSMPKLEQFFQAYGPAEVATMCLQLGTSPTEDAPPIVVTAAKAALENSKLTGEADLRDGPGRLGPAAPAPGVENIAPNQGYFDMGQAVPVAEPDWSGAHRGLCIYISRVLQPAWEEHVTKPVKKDTSSLCCSIPMVTLQALEERLRALEAFLREFQQRRRSRQTRVGGLLTDTASVGRGYDSLSGPAGQFGPPAAKRPRFEEAAKLEDHKTAAIRALVQRAAEGCFLLRVLGEANLPNLTVGLDDGQRSRLAGLRLRDWVASTEGDKLAGRLISGLVGERIAASRGDAEEQASILQAGCPSYFREEDAKYYRASGLLQQAEAATSPADREALLRESLRLMSQVPLCVDLGRVEAQLAHLRAFDAVVELALRRAAAMDPENVAGLPGDEGRDARQARYDQCYCHVVKVLRFLIDPAAADGQAPANGDAHLSPAERNKFRKSLLQRAAKAEDPYFHEVLYKVLVEMRALGDLQQLDSPQLEAHLRKQGGLPPAGAPSPPIGPLTREQVANAEILAKLYIERYDYRSAAGVYAALASRRSGVGETVVDLSERAAAFQCAVLQAKAAGDSEEADRLEVRRRLLEVQKNILAGIEARIPKLEGDEAARAGDAAAELREAPRELADLFNDYAVPQRLWAAALDLVALAGYSDAAYIRQLWDVYLRQGWDEAIGKDEAMSPEAAFEAVCTRVETAGQQYGPDADVFPGPHIALRLAQVAVGLWPEDVQGTNDADRVTASLLKACRGSDEAVQKMYEAVLTARDDDLGDEAANRPLRSFVFLALAALLDGIAQRLLERAGPAAGGLGYRGTVRRDAGALKEACEQYGVQARRLAPDPAAVDAANHFAATARALNPILGPGSGWGR